ncbi:MAG: FMN-binding protein [Firmicutes bacterium]|nr:FMN-binding protein [Bacillota bacterium]
MKKLLSLSMVLALSVALLVGCNQQPATPSTTYKDGTYVAVSDANDKGYMRAEVTVKDDKIESVSLVGLDSLGLEKTEDYPYAEYHSAIVDLAEEMVNKNTWDVDSITGATGTSEQSKQAVKRAMEKALVEPASSNQYFDGTFMAISEQNDKGWTIAWVTIENDKITDVKLVSTTAKQNDDGSTSFVRKDDSYPYPEYFEAIETLPEQFVANNGTDIEGVTGATGTTEQAKDAVEQALAQAAR